MGRKLYIEIILVQTWESKNFAEGFFEICIMAHEISKVNASQICGRKSQSPGEVKSEPPCAHACFGYIK